MTPAHAERPAKERLVLLAALALWLAFVVFVTSRHEPWRDEVLALSVAIAPAHAWELPSLLRYEGHPVLWYLVLRWGWMLVRTPVVIKIASVAVAASACAIFVFRAPFPAWQRILFLAGILPLYEYSVIGRNYGIAMLLLFVFATVHHGARRGPIAGGVALGLLANTNAPATILTPILFLAWFTSELRRDASGVWRQWRLWILAALIMTAGFAGSVATAMPDSDTAFVNTERVTAGAGARAFADGLRDPGLRFSSIPPRGSRPATWIFITGLLPRLELALAALAGYASVSSFFSVVYSGALRHQGIVSLFVMVLYWMAADALRDAGDRGPVATFGLRVAVPLLLLSQLATRPPESRAVVTSIQRAWSDVESPASSSGAVAAAIAARPDLSDAILLGDPPQFLEPFAYYLPNRTYLPRENRFGAIPRITTSQRADLSLHDLLETGRTLRKREQVPVVILLGFTNLAERKGPIRRLGTTFSWDEAQLRELADATRLLGRFHGSLLREDYDAFVLSK